MELRRRPLATARLGDSSRSRKQASTVLGVTLTHPHKVLYPESGLTKLDLARYVESVSALLLPQVAGRPLMMLRCPSGRRRPCFFQKHPGGRVHPSLEPVEIQQKDRRAHYLVVRDPAGLVALVQMGVLEIHVWGARVDRLAQPDRMVFDIDPGLSTPWPQVTGAAKRLHELLAQFDLESFVKTTGGRGLHVVVPLARGPGWDMVRAFSAAVAARMAREAPERFTTLLPKRRRRGRIFLDTMRNLRGHTWVAPYSPRARAGAPVSLPVVWTQVTARLRSAQFTVETLPRYLARRVQDPWAGIEATRQTLTRAMLRDAARAAGGTRSRGS
jgi:bifunctional non-homologous end joining protein LigD